MTSSRERRVDLVPVSYTHLDVYKRQDWHMEECRAKENHDPTNGLTLPAGRSSGLVSVVVLLSPSMRFIVSLSKVAVDWLSGAVSALSVWLSMKVATERLPAIVNTNTMTWKR